MNLNAFRHFYNYHFAENRKIWESYITALTEQQFTQAVNYSHGSVRDQILHLINVDNAWFSDLRGSEISESLADDVADLKVIRTHWDGVEQAMRDYLDNLQDEQLSQKPIAEGEDKDLILWQILLHVANHGTDHRAQLLRVLNDLGLKTSSQDYIFYVYENL